MLGINLVDIPAFQRIEEELPVRILEKKTWIIVCFVYKNSVEKKHRINYPHNITLISSMIGNICA